MSTKVFFRNTSIAALGVAGMTLTACASGQASSRYGNVYDYESGQGCAPSACTTAPAVTSSRYGSSGYVQQAPVNPVPVMQAAPAMQVSPGVVYADCSVLGANCGMNTASTYTSSSYTNVAPTYSQSYTSGADCPAGTTMQTDGTCMQSSYTAPASTSSYSSSTYSSGEMAECPAGTSKQSDGTCMQSSSYSSTTSYSSGSSYSTSTASMGAPVNCPAGTTAQSDGTCMQGSGVSAYTGGTATIYSGDATSTTTSTSYGGYTNGGYTAKDYLPIRK